MYIHTYIIGVATEPATQAKDRSDLESTPIANAEGQPRAWYSPNISPGAGDTIVARLLLGSARLPVANQ